MHPICPRNRCATISGRNVRRCSIPQAAIQRPRHQHPSCSLRHGICLHPSMMPQRKAAAEYLRCFMHPICPRNRCATISGRNVRRCSIPQAVIQRPRHQHPRSSLRHSNGLHPSTMIRRLAAAEYLRCSMHPSCPRNTCATVSERNVCRYSIAHAVIQRQQQLHPRSCLNDSVCQHPSMLPLRKPAAQCAICWKHPNCPRNRCAILSGRNARRFSIAHAVNEPSSNCNRAAVCATAVAGTRADAAVESCFRVSHALQTPQLPPIQVCCYSWANCATIQHRSRCNSKKH